MKYPHVMGIKLGGLGYYRRTCQCCASTRVDWDDGRVQWLSAGAQNSWTGLGDPPCSEGATSHRKAVEMRREAQRLTEAEEDLDRLEGIAGGTIR